MKKVNSAEKGYVLAMTVAITTIVTILLGTIFTTSIISTNSTNTLVGNNTTKRKIKNDAYLACSIINQDQENTFSNVETSLRTCDFEISTYVEDSFDSTTNTFKLEYKRLTADIKYDASFIPTNIRIYR